MHKKAGLFNHLQQLLLSHEIKYRKCRKFVAKILDRCPDVVNSLVNDNEPIVDFAHRPQFHERAQPIKPVAFRIHRLINAGGIDYCVHSGISLGHERLFAFTKKSTRFSR
jgi:hypothetical protein